jgi:hypothetical protein
MITEIERTQATNQYRVFPCDESGEKMQLQLPHTDTHAMIKLTPGLFDDVKEKWNYLSQQINIRLDS